LGLTVPWSNWRERQKSWPVADLGELLDAIWSERNTFDDALSELLRDRAAHQRLVGRMRSNLTR
jgi:hypothetical protein